MQTKLNTTVQIQMEGLGCKNSNISKSSVQIEICDESSITHAKFSFKVNKSTAFCLKRGYIS